MTQPVAVTKPPEAIRPAEQRPTAETFPPPSEDELSWASLPVENVVRPKPRTAPLPPTREAIRKPSPEEQAIIDQAVLMLEHNPDASKRDVLKKPKTMDLLRDHAREVVEYQQKIRTIPKNRQGRFKNLDPELFAYLAKLHKQIRETDAFLGLNSFIHLNLELEDKISAPTPKREAASSSQAS